MTFRVSPGVYPQLEDLSERIPNFPSSIGAVCFASRRGPTGLQFVTDKVQFIELYGSPTPGNEAVPGNGHDTALLFLEEASSLYCLRVINEAVYSLGAMVISGGSGYTAVPTVTITDPSGGGITATAIARIQNGIVSELIITNVGSGYTTPPTVTITAPGGAGATATATASISGGAVTYLNLVSFLRSNLDANNDAIGIGTDYENSSLADLAALFTFASEQTPLLYFLAENPGEWANDLRVGINQVNLGVSKLQTLVFDGPVLSGQSIQYSYQDGDRSIDFATDSDTTLANLAADIAGISTAITAVVEIVSETISGVTITAGGSSYIDGDPITFTGGGGTGATATAVVDVAGAITGVIITNPGSGYISVPTVVFGGSGSNAAGTAAISVNDNRTIRINGTDPNNALDLSQFLVVGMGTTPAITHTVERDNIPSTRAFNLQIFEGESSQPREEWEVSLNEQVDGYGDQLEVAYQVNEGPNRSNRIRVVQADSSEDFAILNPVPINSLQGGDDGNAPADQALVAGWGQFENTQEVTVRLLLNGGYTSPVVQQKIKNVAQSRRDAFAIIDLPIDSQRTQAAVNYRNNQLNINSSYAAIYGPDIEIFDEYTGKRRFVPPSGAVGAAYAFTARTRDVWFAPAGLSRGLVNRALGLRYNYAEGDRDLLAQAQINPIIRIGPSITVWGESTLQVQPSALQSVPIRLLMTHVEVAIADSLNSNVFDPNDPQTRFLIRSRIEDFLLPIRRGRGIEEFQVVCDENNNPPATRDQRVLNVDVYIKPVLAALYIRLTSILTRSTASFDELISLRNAA